MTRPPPRPTLFPYTTLFRSRIDHLVDCARVADIDAVADHPPAISVHQLGCGLDRKSTRLNSSHVEISYAVFCLKKKKTRRPRRRSTETTRPSIPSPRHHERP